jgi:hypothetical protein
MTGTWNDASPEAQELASEYYEIDLAEMLVTARAERIRAVQQRDRLAALAQDILYVGQYTGERIACWRETLDQLTDPHIPAAAQATEEQPHA